MTIIKGCWTMKVADSNADFTCFVHDLRKGKVEKLMYRLYASDLPGMSRID
jgi:hypothetical protein